MKIEQTWSASSRVEHSGKDQELVRLAGQWNSGLTVSITKPYEFSQGPVKKIKEVSKSQ